MTQKRPSSATNTHQTDSEIETVLRQLAPFPEPVAPGSEAPSPMPESVAPTPQPRAPRGGFNPIRFRSGLKLLAVGAVLMVSGRCAYLERQVSVAANEAAVIEARARACERRVQRRNPSDAPDERGVRPDLDDASRRIRGVGPIQQRAPGVFTNRDPDPAEMSPP